MTYQTLPTAEVTPSPMDAVGLTKRELFAAMAMQGMCGNSLYDMTYKDLAEHSVKAADALIEALNERKEQP